jgi:hypothetical protein
VFLPIYKKTKKKKQTTNRSVGRLVRRVEGDYFELFSYERKGGRGRVPLFWWGSFCSLEISLYLSPLSGGGSESERKRWAGILLLVRRDGGGGDGGGGFTFFTVVVFFTCS